MREGPLEGRLSGWRVEVVAGSLAQRNERDDCIVAAALVLQLESYRRPVNVERIEGRRSGCPRPFEGVFRVDCV